MKTAKKITVCCLLVLCPLVILGCGKKADENKPMGEVRAEAEKMDASGLRAAAMAYKEAVVAKKGEVEKLSAKLNGIPATEMLGNEAKELKADIDKLTKSVSALEERFDVYYQKLKEKGGDLSGLEI